MAFSKDQSRRARSVVLLVLLVAVVSLAAVVLFGGGPLGDASRDASSGSSVAASNAADGSAASSQAQQDGHTMADVDASYDAATKQLFAKYEANPSDPSTLLNVANGYFDWGATALSHAQGAEDEQHATDLFNQATHYYDEYLATYPGSKSAEVDRAVSMFYAGDTPRRSRRSRPSSRRTIPSVPHGRTSGCSTMPTAAPTTRARPMSARSRRMRMTRMAPRRTPSSASMRWIPLLRVTRPSFVWPRPRIPCMNTQA